MDDTEIKEWWDSTRQQVHQRLKLHSNNTIKGLKKTVSRWVEIADLVVRALIIDQHKRKSHRENCTTNYNRYWQAQWKSFWMHLYNNEKQAKHHKIRRHDGKTCSGSCDVQSFQEELDKASTAWLSNSVQWDISYLCLGDYERIWHPKKLRVNNNPPPSSQHEVEDLIPESHYTRKSNGTKQSWANKGWRFSMVAW